MNEHSEESSTPLLRKWIGLIGVLIAPTTVITALCYYFGYFYTKRYFAYFGIESNALGLNTSDYVLRSIRPLFLPIVVLLLIWLAAVWVGQLLVRAVDAERHRQLLLLGGWVFIAVGVLGIARGFVGMAVPTLKPDNITALTPIGLGFGAAVLIAGCWVLALSRRPDAPRRFLATERTSLLVATVAIVLALCWLTTMYGGYRGEEDAKSTEHELWARETAVMVDTAHPLNAPPGMLVESTLPATAGGAEIFRYECFRVLAVRGDQWILVPAKWRAGDGYAVILTAGPDYRIAMVKHLGIARKTANNRDGGWPCIEKAPMFAGRAEPFTPITVPPSTAAPPPPGPQRR